MLDTDTTPTDDTPTGTGETSTAPDTDQVMTQTPPRAPRKRASRKTAATAPTEAAPAEGVPAAGSDESSQQPAAPARKRASRKRAVASSETAPAETAPTETAERAPAAEGAATDDAPARKPARKRAARKTAVPAEDAANPVEQTSTGAGPTEVTEDAAAPDEAAPTRPARKRASRKSAAAAASAETPTEAADGQPEPAAPAAPAVLFVAPDAPAPTRRRRGAAKKTAADESAATDEPAATDVDLTAAEDAEDETAEPEDVREAAIEQASGARRRRRRGRRGRGGAQKAEGDDQSEGDDQAEGEDEADTAETEAADETDAADESGEEGSGTSRRRRRRRRSGTGDDDSPSDDPPNTVTHVRDRKNDGDDGVKAVKGSTRLEAKRQRRRDGRDTSRRRAPILTESEFLARREAVDRVMAVRQAGDRTQIAVLEDGILVEHYVTRASATSYVGNVYLGRVQNVLPSMEAAFVDIGKGRNGVLYAGEVNWDAAGLEGKSRTIEQALKSGDSVLVQVTKDPIGHKGARLTSQVSLPGRFLVYVPGGGMTGISRRLPDTERHRLKSILKKIVPEDAGVIVRTAAEGASEEDLTRDVERLQAQWQKIQDKAANGKNAPTLLHGEPDLAIRVVRDVFNEDFQSLVVQGDQAWTTVSDYVEGVAHDLAERVSRHTKDTDLFHDLRVDEQLKKALDRKVYLPSGGSLVIDRTEAMTVIDVNTGKFVGSGGNLEQTVTRNNLEAAEEVVRQLRLRDVGGIVVIDFIDMVLESNRELVLRRLTECLGRDRTKHQVAEVTSLGLVQMTRKRVGEGLLEAFSEPCEHCHGRGVVIHDEPVDQSKSGSAPEDERPAKGKRRRGGAAAAPAAPVEDDDDRATPEQRKAANAAIAAIHRAAAGEKDDSDGEPDAMSSLASDLMAAALNGSGDRRRSAPQRAVAEPAPVEIAADPAPIAADPARPAPKATDGPARESAPVETDTGVPATLNGGDGGEAKASGRRRRRSASRPAGPPVQTG